MDHSMALAQQYLVLKIFIKMVYQEQESRKQIWSFAAHAFCPARCPLIDPPSFVNTSTAILFKMIQLCGMAILEVLLLLYGSSNCCQMT